MDRRNYTHRCQATAYYPGVECGMNYTRLLHGWGDPDISTLHHPYGVVADGNTDYVTGWSGKLQELTYEAESGVEIQRFQVSSDGVDIMFLSPFDSWDYQLETRTSLSDGRWIPLPDVEVRPEGGGRFVMHGPVLEAARGFLRITARPRR